jgi:hypothetical protein
MINTMGTAIHCTTCGQPISPTLTDQSRRWTHDDTDEVSCRTGMAVPDVQRLYGDAVANLDERYTLIWPAIDDRLTPRQIQVLLDGVNEYESDEFSDVDEWESECRWQASEAILGDLLDDQARTLLADAGLLDALRLEITDRDDSDAVTCLLNTSPHALFRYDLRVDVPDHTVLADDGQRRKAFAEIADAVGLDATDQRTVARLAELIDNAFYGGRLYALWYGDPTGALYLATPAACPPRGRNTTDAHRAVTFTSAHLIVLDHLNGSGHTIPIDTITADWTPRRVSIDASGIGPGHSWHEIAGPSTSDYGGDFTLHRGNEHIAR